MSQNIGKRWKNGNTKSYVRKKGRVQFLSCRTPPYLDCLWYRYALPLNGADGL